MARPKGSTDIASSIRGAFKRAVLMLEEEKKPLSLIIKQQMEERPLETLKAISTFCPKEVDITQRTVKDVSQLSSDELDQLAMVASAVIGGNGAEEEGESEKLSDSLH